MIASAADVAPSRPARRSRRGNGSPRSDAARGCRARQAMLDEHVGRRARPRGRAGGSRCAWARGRPGPRNASSWALRPRRATPATVVAGDEPVHGRASARRRDPLAEVEWSPTRESACAARTRPPSRAPATADHQAGARDDPLLVRAHDAHVDRRGSPEVVGVDDQRSHLVLFGLPEEHEVLAHVLRAACDELDGFQLAAKHRTDVGLGMEDSAGVRTR